MSTFFESEVESALEHTGLVIRRVFSVSRGGRRALASDPNLIRDLMERRTAEGRTPRRVCQWLAGFLRAPLQSSYE